MDYDIIIAGAGPVGLSLALRLVKAGKKVLLIEKNATTHEHSRAPAIWPRTQEILSGLGVIDEFLEQGIVADHPQITDVDTGKVLLTLPLEEVKDETKYPHLLVLPQSKTERILCDALQKEKSADVRFSCTLISFTQDAHSVSVRIQEDGKEKEVTASFLVGCDGAHSTVRKILGVHLKGATYKAHAALADVRLLSDKPFPLLSTKDVLVIGIKIEADVWRLILIYFSKNAMTIEERTKRAMKQLFPGESYENVWQSEFRLHNRISTQFVKGRVALAGDAAHLNSPVGGQGMNAGIQDTEVLGAALLKAIQNDSPSHLRPYARMRKGSIKSGVNNFTNTLTQWIFLANGKALRWIFKGWNLLLKIPFIRKRFLRKVTMLG